jgi:hypothetical protein
MIASLPEWLTAIGTRTGETAKPQGAPCDFDLTLTAENCDASFWVATIDFEAQSGDRRKPVVKSLIVQPRSTG